MRRASSSRAHRTPTTSAFSTCVSSCAGSGDCARARRPVRSAAVARPGRAGLRRGAHARTARRAVVGLGPDAFERSPRRNRARERRSGCGQTPGRTSPPRSARLGAEVFPIARGVLGHESRSLRRDGERRCDEIAARPPLAGPRVLLTGAPVDGHALHEAIESHGAVVVDEVGPWGSGAARTCGSTTTRSPRSPTNIELTRSVRVHR